MKGVCILNPTSQTRVWWQWNDSIARDLKAPLVGLWIITKKGIYKTEKLHHSLILPNILMTFKQKCVIPAVTSHDRNLTRMLLWINDSDSRSKLFDIYNWSVIPWTYAKQECLEAFWVFGYWNIWKYLEQPALSSLRSAILARHTAIPGKSLMMPTWQFCGRPDNRAPMLGWGCSYPAFAYTYCTTRELAEGQHHIAGGRKLLA